MAEELKKASKEEIQNLKEIMRKGFIDTDEEFEIYSKFVDIKRKLKDEGLL